MKLETEIVKVPGPGTYEYVNHAVEGPQFVLGLKTKVSGLDGTATGYVPGPGA
jgi:hypothetical protein